MYFVILVSLILIACFGSPSKRYFVCLVLIVWIGLLTTVPVCARSNEPATPDYVYVGPGPAIFVPRSRSLNIQNIDCGNDAENLCFQKLQTFLNLTALPFPQNSSELEKLCTEAISGYECATKLGSSSPCLSVSDKNLMLELVKMGQYMVYMFCDNPELNPNAGYRKYDLLNNSKCISSLRRNFDCCAERSKIPDLPILNLIDPNKSFVEKQLSSCCPFSSYITCAHKAVMKTCGNVAGNVTYEYIRRAAGEQMQAMCQKIPGYPEPHKEGCMETAAACCGAKFLVYVELIALMVAYFLYKEAVYGRRMV